MSADQQKIDLVLLIDDDDVVNTLNTIIITQSGLVQHIESVRSGEDALLTLRQWKAENKWPSIIFVDINMPCTNGWEFLELFRENFLEFKSRCVVCMLSSSLDTRDEEKAQNSDLVDFYIPKPLTRQSLNSVCKRVPI